MTVFDYELCMKQDDGQALCRGKEVSVLTRGYLQRGPGRDEKLLYAVQPDNGAAFIVSSCELRNLDPPQPELKPELPMADVVWWKDMEGKVRISASLSNLPFSDELCRITVDPNAMTPDELAGHGVHIWPIRRHRQPDRWGFMPKGFACVESNHPSHAEACRAATEWLREQGKIGDVAGPAASIQHLRERRSGE